MLVNTTIQKPKVTKFTTYKNNKKDIENNNNSDTINNSNIIDMETTPTRTQDYIIDDNFTHNLHNEVINNTDKLLDLWINILSQSSYNQQLLSNKLWQGLTMEQLKPIEDTKSKEPENLNEKSKSNLEDQEETQELIKPCHQSVPTDLDCKGKVWVPLIPGYTVFTSLSDHTFSHLNSSKLFDKFNDIKQYILDASHINYKGNIHIAWLLGLTCTDNF
ncbi:17020_t:CDS:2 [Entrophospora sp. SA101]|nr:17020_t:CDS:2 [Entrophospora sp. SA101]